MLFLFCLGPHVVQVLAIFRLLGVDHQLTLTERANGALPLLSLQTELQSHLVQVSTGGGKSIVLGTCF